MATAAALVLGVGMLLADRLVVTDREQIESLFPRLAAAAEAGDKGTIFAALDPSLAPLRAEAERRMGEFHPDEVRITRLEVTVTGPESDRRARAGMLIHLRGEARGGSGTSAPVTALIELDVDLRKDQGRFLITDFDPHEPRTIGPRRP